MNALTNITVDLLCAQEYNNCTHRVVSESRQMKRKMVAVKRKKQEEDNQDDSVPDTAAKEFNGGHGLKTSLTAGFEKIL